MKKLTKIVATIGPASDSEEMIERLIKSGVNVFRFNFKHSSIEWHEERIKRVTTIAQRLNMPIGTLLDLQGPEIRIKMSGAEINMKKGDLLLLGPEALEGKQQGFSISHPEIIQHLTEGQKLVADDGAFSFYIQIKDGKHYLHSETDGTLKTNKSLNIPGADFPFPVLVDRDREGLQLAARTNMDFIALSFVRSAEDLKITHEEMKKQNVKSKLIAKIETQKALGDLDAIINHADGLMVARGDLGVEMPIEQVPFYQKEMIRKCLEKGIPVITATQMIQSMIDNPYPTRAEISDIANAVYDYTDAVMLSGETASGKYPLEAVEYMNKTVVFNEGKLSQDTRLKFNHHEEDVESMICDAAYNLYLSLEAKGLKVAGFMVFTHTGKTARLISSYRPNVPVYAFTPHQDISEQLTVNFGVYPHVQEISHNTEVKKDEVKKALDFLVQHQEFEKGQKVIILHGDTWAQTGGTSTLKIVEI